MTQAPNIVFILADDLGYADLSAYGQRDYETKHLDRLAEQGVRFLQAYSNSAVCSATRFALMTGRYQYRLRGGLEEPIYRAAVGMPPEHPTLPSLLRKAGYETALIGKWHLGKPPNFGPLKSGYDYFFGNYRGAIDYFTHKGGVGPTAPHDLFENDASVHRNGYYTHILADEACKYVAEHGSCNPFFLSLHFTAPHWPWVGPDDEHVSRSLLDLQHFDGGNLKVYAEMVTALDRAVGQVLWALEARGMTDNTIVIFTSDNGGERFSKTWPFVGQKTELLEGGLRIPTLMRWPARLRPQVQDQVMITMDWLPTLLSAANTAHDPAYPPDGENILPVLEGACAPYPRKLYWRFKSNTQRAVRDGDMKYLKINDNEFLFNVIEDLRERANLKRLEPQTFERLKEQWEAWERSMLPITDDIFSLGIQPDKQADRYRQD